MIYANKWVGDLVLGSIRIYQMAISPYLPGLCRHAPTCSVYVHESISKYGLMKGMWLGTKRLSRCHPIGTGGYDPVP